MSTYLTSQEGTGATGKTGLSDAQSSQMTQLVLAAYDRNAYFQYRPDAIMNMLADVQPGNTTSPGSSVKFTFWSDLAAATSKLKEAVDVTAVGMSNSVVTVTPYEYGNAVLTTLKIREDEFIFDFEQDIGNIVAYNMLDTLETLAATAWSMAGQERILAADVDTLDGDTAGHRLVMNEGRRAVAKLRGTNVPPMAGNYYMGVIHPDVEYDLITDASTNDVNWLSAAIRQNYPALERNMIGAYAGIAWMTSPRVLKRQNSNNRDYYTNLIVGRQAYAKAVSVPPRMIQGPVVDTLRRFVPIGWHTYMGWGEFRNAGSWKIQTASSLGDNT